MTEDGRLDTEDIREIVSKATKCKMPLSEKDFNEIVRLAKKGFVEGDLLMYMKIIQSMGKMSQEKKIKYCEACNNNEVQWILTDAYDEKIKYHVCTICLGELVNFRLSPELFRNLIENGHSALEFLLHDDFYDEEGNALQPM